MRLPPPSSTPRACREPCLPDAALDRPPFPVDQFEFGQAQQITGMVDALGRPDKGNDKGKVEGLIGWIRRNLLVPVLRATSLNALNEQLLEGCRRRLGDRLRGHQETISERLVRDVTAFHDLPSVPYEACSPPPEHRERLVRSTRATGPRRFCP